MTILDSGLVFVPPCTIILVNESLATVDNKAMSRQFDAAVERIQDS